MSDGEAKGDELDIIKWYVWFMLVLTVLGAGGLWWLYKDVETTRTQIARADDKMTDFAETKNEVEAMLKVFQDNNEDQARSSAFTWFSNAWRRSGIPDESIDMGAWDDPRYDNKGKFHEESITLGIENRFPLEREKIVKFCHEVERASTRLRILELDLRRANRKDLSADAWAGKIKFGFRRARLAD